MCILLTSIEPNCDLVDRLADRRLEDEEQSPRGIVHVNWYETRVKLAQVEWDVGQRVHEVGWQLLVM
jgi:hypothetical protein